MSNFETQEQLEATLKALELNDYDQVPRLVCALIGHSRIQTICMGYFSCGRCGDQLGDSLGSIYPAAGRVVIIGHKCPTCEANYQECDWKDKYLCPDPFADEQKPVAES